MRNLASIQKIDNLSPIENADRIELAQILGWQVVVKKGDFNIGDLCIYIEIDSLLPADIPLFDFLKDSNGKISKIRTIKLKGQVSQGIAFPVSVIQSYFTLPSINIDEDLTDVIGITKYEPEIPLTLRGQVKGNRPDWIPKTDETRVQILQDILDKYCGTSCYVTEKLDGSSFSCGIFNGNFEVSSRNTMKIFNESNIADAFVKIAMQLSLKDKLEKFYSETGTDIVLQGEVIGGNIQGNKYKLNDLDLYFYNAYLPTEYRYLDYLDFTLLLHKLDLKIVPVLDTNFVLLTDINKLVDLAKGKSIVNNQIEREGIVIRPLIEIKDNNQRLEHNRLSFKVINPNFLLKYND